MVWNGMSQAVFTSIFDSWFRPLILLALGWALDAGLYAQRGLSDVWHDPQDPDRWRIPAAGEAVEGTQNFFYVTHHDVKCGAFSMSFDAEELTAPDADHILVLTVGAWGSYRWTVSYVSGEKLTTNFDSSTIGSSQIGWGDFARLAGRSVNCEIAGTVTEVAPDGSFTGTLNLESGAGPSIIARFSVEVLWEYNPLPDYRSIPYGPHWQQAYDLYLPEDPISEPMPLIVFIHGGGWEGNDKQNGQSTARSYIAKGVAVASVNYRYISDGETDPPVGAPMFESARAIQQIRYLAPSLGIDPERIVFAGVSAGGCTSIWLALHDDLAEPESPDPIARQSTRPFAVYSQQAQTSLDPMQMREWIPSITYGSHAFFTDQEISGSYSLKFQFWLDNRASILDEIGIFNPYAHASAFDPLQYLDFNGRTSEIPASGGSHATHHPMFGIKLRERLDALGVETYFTANDDKAYQYSGDFMLDMLTTRFNPDLDGDGISDYWERIHYGDAAYYGAQDDPNGDGQPVLLDYAMDIHPLEPIRESERPYATLIEEDGQSYWVIRFRRSNVSAENLLNILLATELTGEPWEPIDLDAFQAQERLYEADPDGDGTAVWRELRIPLANLPEQRLFFRASAVIE